MDKIKKSFLRVRKDIENLKREIYDINSKLDSFLREFNEKTSSNTSTQEPIKSTDSFDNSTHPSYFKPLKGQNLGISTGNQGVSTDRQTDRQTDNWTHNQEIFKKTYESPNNLNERKDSIDKATELLNSLDNIKKEIRIKFKRLTNQEMLVFSTIYQIEEEKGSVNYLDLSKRLNLSESSIRDYIQRLIKKGIPVEKKRVNNKSISLSISSNLKKMTQLATILKLRDL